MKLKLLSKGFTLIELLAVIIILGFITLIVVPVVLTLKDNSEKKALRDSAQGLIRTAQYYNSDQNLNGTPIEGTIEFIGPDYKSSDGKKLNFNGDKFGGKLVLTKNGDEVTIAVAIYNDGYCAYKKVSESKVKVEEKTSLSLCTNTIQ